MVRRLGLLRHSRRCPLRSLGLYSSPDCQRYVWAAPVRDGRSRGYTDRAPQLYRLGARQMFLEDKIGTVEPGKKADIAVWDRDLYSVPTDQIKDMNAC